MCSQDYCDCNVHIELTLFQMISLLHGKKVKLYFAQSFISHRKKKSLGENGNYEKSPNLFLQ